MMNVTPSGSGYRLELPDGTYAYLTAAEATRLFDNLRDALRPEPHPLSEAVRAPYQRYAAPVQPGSWTDAWLGR